MKEILQDAWKKDRRGFFWILCLNIAAAVVSAGTTVLLVPMLDLLQLQQGEESLLPIFGTLSYVQRAVVILCAFVGLIILRALLNAMNTIKRERFLERYELSVRAELHKGISESAWEPLAQIRHSELANLMLSQCRQVRFCLQVILGMTGSAVSALLQLVIAVWLSPYLTLIVLAVGVLFMLLLRPFQKRSRACGEESLAVTREAYQEVNNQLDSLKETRAYGVEEESARLFREVSQRQFEVTRRTVRLRAMPQLLYSVAAAVLIAIAFVISVLVLKTDVAKLVILVYIFARLWPVFASWQGQIQSIQSYMPAFEKIHEMLKRLKKESMPVEKSGPILPFCKEVTFDKVGFTYQDGSNAVLKDVSFTLPFGSVTALVGRSGAGKSTTADLLLGFLYPTEGRISIDGEVLTADNVVAWRKALGYVPQEPLIMDTTIRENLRRFHPDATEEEMVRALKDALAWPFVEKLEKGIDTVLGSRGIGLSGGEKQRIVLARVLLGNPRLVILDEATSALDYESENAIRQTIQTLKGKATVLIIAHRFATIRTADRAVVLDNGGVAESGSLQELLTKQDGYLAGMVTVD